MSDNVEIDDDPCPKCTADRTYRSHCGCDDGFSHHDCGEDCCCCLHPEPNVVCDDCQGRGFNHWCRQCGWDLCEHRYIGWPVVKYDPRMAVVA